MAPPCTIYPVGELIHFPGALQGSNLQTGFQQICIIEGGGIGLQAYCHGCLQVSDPGSMGISIGLPLGSAAGFPEDE